VRSVKPVLYNQGGYVAHLSVKIDGFDSFNAFVEAANIAHAYGGRVERLYEDSKGGQRTGIGGVERAGLVLEPGSLDDPDRLSVIEARLREERAVLKRGKGAAALDRVIALFDRDESV
jgi:hypothetical protein